MSPDGHEQRIAESEERAREDMDRLDLAELLADESRDVPPLSEAELTGSSAVLTPTERGLVSSAVVLQMQRDALRDVLMDLAFGAEMMLEPVMGATGTFKRYAEEVLRVARAGLKQAKVGT